MVNMFSTLYAVDFLLVISSMGISIAVVIFHTTHRLWFSVILDVHTTFYGCWDGVGVVNIVSMPQLLVTVIIAYPGLYSLIVFTISCINIIKRSFVICGGNTRRSSYVHFILGSCSRQSIFTDVYLSEASRERKIDRLMFL